MDFNEIIKLVYWNKLVMSHLPELIMVLTAGVVALADRHVRKMVSRWTSSMGVLSRFFVFLLIVSVGYTVLTLGVAWSLREGVTFSGGAYAAPAVLAVLVIAAIEAQRQRQF